ncbi:hypothetical protein M378DRAFT_187647 [Amanita muscaria Koide BX008]|uniref:NADH:flavin oxidoreductase/NADH oxidase N-terminal domain-containing protein n=1 Tax=Amanita muscaria (strain Koide BX008) TaxID=946122 RepID=A0A0C2WW85_AMAMK|nr:hypothetical protein M378DRAFT_187647 [Amanita muscaria Koide BX008]
MGTSGSGTDEAELEALSNVLSPISLPCSGRKMANKLVKVALYEHLAPMYGGPPNHLHLGLYKTWGRGNWGMIMTGNVQVSREHLSLGRDIIVPNELTEEALRPFNKLASVIHGGFEENTEHGTASHTVTQPALAIMQLSHGGRQSCKFIGGRRLTEAPLAPSPIRVKEDKNGILAGILHRLLFQTPKEMTLDDIDDVVHSFVKGAVLAWKAGFDGIQLHNAHGYLLAEFLSPKTNQRNDLYSAEKENALRLLKRIVDGIKEAVPGDFVLGIKINSADYVNSQSSSDDVESEERRITEHIVSIAKWGHFDFIEISGGDYETPTFMETPNKSRRQAFFSQFSQHIMQTLDSLPADTQKPLILLTGGLRTPSLLCSVLSCNHADLLGIGRGALLRPDLPLYLQKLCDTSKTIADPVIRDSPFEREPELGIRGFSGWVWSRFPRIPLIGAGVEMAWYGNMMRRLGSANASAADPRPLVPDYSLGAFHAVMKLWFWTLSSPRESERM